MERTQAAARQVSQLGAELGTLVGLLDGMDAGAWRGQTADAFRNNLHRDLVPLLNKARDSFDRAGGALGGWAGRLSVLQGEADELEHEADRRQQALEAAARAAASPPEGADRAVQARLQDGVDQARSAASQLQARADQLHERYLQAAKSVAGQLDRAEGIAPDAPGWLEWMVTGIGNAVSEALDAVGRWVREHAEQIELASDVLSTVSAVAGVLAFIPPLSVIMGPTAVIAGGFAAGLEGALLAAGTENASWSDFALAGGGAAAGFGALKAGRKIVEAYERTGRAGQLQKVHTLRGVATGKQTMVAPGMFRAARDGVSMTRGEVGWRVAKLKAEQAGLASTAYGTPGMVENTQRFDRNTASGRAPWAGGTAPVTP